MLSDRNVERMVFEGGQYNPASEFMPFSPTSGRE
jgi:hypothetical protein